MWHQDISLGDLHYLRSKFALNQGLDGIYLSSFTKATEQFYHNRQFAVKDSMFITWAFLMPENEADYLANRMGWIEDMAQGRLWVIEADMKGAARSAIRELYPLVKQPSALFISGDMVRKIRLL